MYAFSKYEKLLDSSYFCKSLCGPWLKFYMAEYKVLAKYNEHNFSFIITRSQSVSTASTHFSLLRE